MDVFPDLQPEFKAYVNELKIGAVSQLAPLTAEDTAARQQRLDDATVERAKALAQAIDRIVVPPATAHAQLGDFLNDKNTSLLHKDWKTLAKEAQQAKGNELAIAFLLEAQGKLVDLRAEAWRRLFPGGQVPPRKLVIRPAEETPTGVTSTKDLPKKKRKKKREKPKTQQQQKKKKKPKK